jgi:uncharacterized protein YbcV (DUF1398 family)
MDERALRDCTALAFANRITFPETVARLLHAGVERYHADLVALEKTFYGERGETSRHALPLRDPPAIPAAFSQPDVKGAVAASQRGEIDYPEFLRRILAAGVASYFVFLRGGKVVYVGRHGEWHVEPFPRSP